METREKIFETYESIFTVNGRTVDEKILANICSITIKELGEDNALVALENWQRNHKGIPALVDLIELVKGKPVDDKALAEKVYDLIPRFGYYRYKDALTYAQENNFEWAFKAVFQEPSMYVNTCEVSREANKSFDINHYTKLIEFARQRLVNQNGALPYTNGKDPNPPQNLTNLVKELGRPMQ